MQTAKAQISLHICAVRLGTTLNSPITELLDDWVLDPFQNYLSNTKRMKG